jgi:hypothetical protein
MKYIKLGILILLIMLVRCISAPDKKFFIKSVKVTDDVRVDWYVNSSISNFAPDYLQLSSNDKEPFFISFYVSNINFKNDSLFISLWKNNYKKLDSSIIQDIKIKIDTSGKSWNNAEDRLGRLKQIGVDVFKPHFKDVSCPNGECY